MHPDLHCHSFYSDGQHSPKYLVDRARENGITHLSITDHDYITWDLAEEWTEPDLQLIPGVEVSCLWEGKEIHVVGLCITPLDTNLQQLLARQRQLRVKRIQEMAAKLQQQGIDGLLEHFASLKCESWTRSHVAEFLIDTGHAKNWQKAFSRYLTRKGKIYVPFDCCKMSDAVDAIVNAGGIAVLAHPGRYGFSKSKMLLLIEDFVDAGGEALEGSYGNIEPKIRKFLCETAVKRNLYLSLGSDFHDARRQWTDLGKLPPLDSLSKKNAIWHHPRWHFSNSN